MIQDNHGFTYPLTLSILFIFLLFFSFSYTQLLSERKMARETKIIWQREYYMFSSAKKLEKDLQSRIPIPSNGTFQYQLGRMDFQVDLPVNQIEKVTFTFYLNSGEITFGYGYYDINSRKMIKWLEKT